MGSNTKKIVTSPTLLKDGSFVFDINHESDTVKISSAQQDLILESPVSLTIQISPPGSSGKPKTLKVNFINLGAVQ